MSLPELFAQARALSPPERRRFLAERCAGDDALRAELESLLAEHDAGAADTGGLARLVHGAAVAIENAAREPVPDRIGPFEIVRVLGEGGMGTVYEARQVEPVTRHVALKVVRGGMSSRDVLARFDAERQALAKMDHPHVARVLEAGATDDGRPWFAMELVPGAPITDACDARRMDTRARLRLFLTACQGVQHAHHAGIVHRDIKPANLLVAEGDGQPALKVIDFGIAKATSSDLGEVARLTQAGVALGTPAYMSPEQARGAEEAIDTRTDVYSLGVVLYELLAGCLPFDRVGSRTWLEELASGHADVAMPSARVRAQRGEAAETVARARATTPRALVREIAGDLDGIVLRALEPDRERRYPTAAALAADVQRHLDDEPVEARPPSLAYRAGKLVRKHRAWAVAAASLIVALATVAVTSAVQSVRLARERDAARAAQALAEAESRAAHETARLLESLFALSDPHAARREDVTVRELLDRGRRGVQSQLAGQPLIRARLLAALGRVHDSLGMYEEAEPLLSEALAIRRSHFPGGGAPVAESLNDSGRLAQHRGDFAAARSLHEEALAVARAALGPGDPSVTTILNNLAVAHHEAGDAATALPLYEEVLAARRSAPGGGDPAAIAAALSNVAVALDETGDFDRAADLHEEALALQREALGPRHPAVGRSLINLASLRHAAGDAPGSRPLAEEACAIQRETLGGEHPELAACLNNLALIVADLGELDAARALHEEALRIDRRTFGDRHGRVAADLNNLAIVLGETGAFEAAERHLAEALAINRALPGAEIDVAQTLGNLASLLVKKGDLDAARPLLEEAIALREAVLPADDATIAEDRADLDALNARAAIR